MTHDLIKHGARYFECTVCQQTWKTKPRTRCPGLRVYRDHENLPFRTKKQLGYLDYQTSEAALPSPVGCYYSHASGSYISLYDPIQAIKLPRTRRRVTVCITDVLWPVNCMPYLETLGQLRKEMTIMPMEFQRYWQRVNDIANLVAYMKQLTQAEIEQTVGQCVLLVIPPVLIHRFYPSTDRNHDEQHILVGHVVTAYRRYLSQLPAEKEARYDS